MIKLSYIIPAYNEEGNIKKSLDSIHEYTPPFFDYEILVVDHGSKDNTVAIAKHAADIVLIKTDCTVAELRNYGVVSSKGDVLIFLDADVLLTNEWRENISPVLCELDRNEKVVTGSWVCVPDNSTWIENNWFKPLQTLNNSHINSGHMIMKRSMFTMLGGFDKNLETGEDYDLSMRALKANMTVIDNHALRVIHEGYPKTLGQFIRREYWHGKGDAATFHSIVQSKVAIIAVIMLLSHVVIVLNGLFFKDMQVIYLSMIVIVSLPFLSSFHKYKTSSLKTILTNTFLYYVYFMARSFSLLSVFKRRSLTKRQR